MTRETTSDDPRIVRPIEGSVTDAAIYCLFDNQPRMFLSRYLKAKYNMTPEEYRAFCALPDDYPMVAPAYRRGIDGVRKDLTPGSPARHPDIVRPIEGSVTEDGIYCLFDNKKRVMLDRYLAAAYRMTPEQYRQHCGLPDDYPMVAPGYSAERRRLVGIHKTPDDDPGNDDVDR